MVAKDQRAIYFGRRSHIRAAGKLQTRIFIDKHVTLDDVLLVLQLHFRLAAHSQGRALCRRKGRITQSLVIMKVQCAFFQLG